MFYFNSLACYQAFTSAVVADPELLTRCFNLATRIADKPAALYLHAGRPEDMGNYFDFGVYRLPVVNYTDCHGVDRPEHVSIPAFEAKSENLILRGGLVKRAEGWSSHT